MPAEHARYRSHRSAAQSAAQSAAWTSAQWRSARLPWKAPSRSPQAGRRNRASNRSLRERAASSGTARVLFVAW